jgi:predicted NBD/HSP70 family sugar kinase
MRRHPDEVLEHLAAEVELALAEVPRERVLGVGLACPGPLNQHTGVLHRVTGNPAWDGVPLRDRMAERLGLDTVIEKDATAGVLSALGSPERAFISLGDGLDPGLGAGLVLGGRVQRGARTNAGEFGHQCIDPSGPRCACGNRGCLEALCAAALTAGRPEDAARHLGLGIANLVQLLDLDQVVLAGRAVLADPVAYTDAVRATLREQLPDPDWQHVSVDIAEAGAYAIALGAASLVMSRLFD